MIRERGEPAVLDTSKPILDAPVFPDYPANAQTKTPVAEQDLVGDEDDDEDVVDVDEDEDDIIDDEELADDDDDVISGDLSDDDVIGNDLILDDDDDDDL